MLQHCKTSRLTVFGKLIPTQPLIFLSVMNLLLVASPAMAHHAMGGKMPSNFLEGFLSGLAHPLIGFDHFAFIIAIGLLAAAKRQGMLIPTAFIVSAMIGTGTHLLGLNLPGVERLIASSILLFGFLLTQKKDLQTVTVVGLSTIAGVCHGYAYGEAIFGAQMTPVLAYLLGFTCIQLGVAMIAFKLGRLLFRRTGQSRSPSSFRSTGFVICGVGLTLLASQIVDVLVPLPKG